MEMKSSYSISLISLDAIVAIGIIIGTLTVELLIVAKTIYAAESTPVSSSSIPFSATLSSASAHADAHVRDYDGATNPTYVNSYRYHFNITKFIKQESELKNMLEEFKLIKPLAPTLSQTIDQETKVFDSESETFIYWVTDNKEISDTLLKAILITDEETIKFIIQHHLASNELIKKAFITSLINETTHQRISKILTAKTGPLQITTQDIEKELLLYLKADDFKAAEFLINKLNQMITNPNNRHATLLGEILYSELCLAEEKNYQIGKGVQKLCKRVSFLLSHGADANGKVVSPSNQDPMHPFKYIFGHHGYGFKNLARNSFSYFVHPNFRKHLATTFIKYGATVKDSFSTDINAEDLQTIKKIEEYMLKLKFLNI